MIEFAPEKMEQKHTAKITVIGIGGAGGNTINSMIDAGYENVTFIAANTDSQALHNSKADHLLQLGMKATKGLGAGANPEIGMRAAQEDLDKILDLVGDADIVFLTAGMGGGTGSGALPVIASALKEKGILTIAIVTKPFSFEGKKRELVATAALEKVKASVDTVLIMPNQKLLELVEENVSMIDAFALINGVLHQSVKGIADIISRSGHINVDFADVRTIMKDMGLAVMGTGRASGKDRSLTATQQAISSPLLENMSIKGARGVLLNITGGTNLGLHEMSTAASLIYEQADVDANIILGSVIDETMGDDLMVTVIATGFPAQEAQKVSAEIKVQPTIKDIPEQRAAKPVQEKRIVHDQVQSVYEKPVSMHNSSSTSSQDTNYLDVPAFMRRPSAQSEETSEQ